MSFTIPPTNGTSSPDDMLAPLYTSAILLPVTAFPSWILCIPPLFWHFRQGNIAIGSLILWVCLINFFNSINPLIWPRENLSDWWNGNIWCDIHVRIQIGSIVGTTASTAMIVRKLARVMDTNSMTVTTSKNRRLRAQLFEVVWCWGYPLVLIILYYVVQPVRYLIYSIQGCLAAYDSSWPSVVLSFMWAPITTLVAAGYASILVFRLYTYRLEFSRLLSAQNTTKSRFIRLFLICVIVICVYLPYTFYLLSVLIKSTYNNDPYSWSRVHDPRMFNSIMKTPTFGVVPIDKWVQVATGYVVFFVFGTGADAWKTYRSIAIGVGLGKWFPALHRTGNTAHRTVNSMGTWRSRAKSILWSRSGSIAHTTTVGTMGNASIVLSDIRRTESREAVLPPRPLGSTRSSFLSRVFTRWSATRHTVLPLSTPRSHFVPKTNDTRSAPQDLSLTSVSSHAWASQTDKASSHHSNEDGVVRVFREVRIGSQDHEGGVGNKSDDMA